MESNADGWIPTGQAAKIADRDRRTIVRWADKGLVISRRGPSGHRQILKSSLEAVSKPAYEPTSAATQYEVRLVLERWFAEMAVVNTLAVDDRVRTQTLETWLGELDRLDDVLHFVRGEIESAVRQRDYDAA